MENLPDGTPLATVTLTLARCPNGASRTAVHPSRTIRCEGAARSAFCVVQVADAARQSVLVLYATANPSGAFAIDDRPDAAVVDKDDAWSFAFDGDYAQGANGALTIGIGGRQGGDEYDVLVITGGATLGGTLNIELIDGFVPDLGDTFEILTFASASGDFGVYNELNIGGGKRFEPKLGPNSLVLEVVPGGCTGKEKLKKPKCRERRGVNRMTVKLVNGLEGDTFRVELSSGKTKQGTINEKGAGKAKFKKIPSGPGTATTTFGCGAVKQKTYACP